MRMKLIDQPVWLVGFRPFFILAGISGIVLPLTWVLVFAGVVAPELAVPALRWHSHEMFYGFGWALLGGFLLTATKNWLGIRGYHGSVLIVLVVLWLAERGLMAYGGALPGVVIAWLALLFMTAIVSLLLASLLKHHQADSYRDNVYFILALPWFLPAKWMMLDVDADPAIGVAMTLGLFRLCFLLMLERTLQPFMRGAFGVSLKRITWLDHAIKCLALALVFSYWLPEVARQVSAGTLAILLLVRWCYWHPLKALSRIDIGVMYLGYLAIALQLLIVSGLLHDLDMIGSVSIHLFTLGAIGLIAPAMIVRISRGHTGRKAQFDRVDKAVIWTMLLGLILRLLAPQFFPAYYMVWLYATALCWMVSFGVLCWRYIPYLLKPRIDGKIH